VKRKNSVIEIKVHLRIVFVDLLKKVPIFYQRLQLILNILTSSMIPSVLTDILKIQTLGTLQILGKILNTFSKSTFHAMWLIKDIQSLFISELKSNLLVTERFLLIQSFEGMAFQRNRCIMPLLAHVVTSSNLEQFLITFVGRTIFPLPPITGLK
jgi:hypothetical protein